MGKVLSSLASTPQRVKYHLSKGESPRSTVVGDAFSKLMQSLQALLFG